MIKKLVVALEVLKVGKRLANPIPWKNAQALSGLLIASIPVLIKGVNTFTGFEIELTSDQISDAATLFAGFGVSAFGLYQWWASLATSDKVGLQDKRKS